MTSDDVGKSGRPANELLRRLSPHDFAMISPYLDQFDASADRVLYNPGDLVESVHFPCGASAAAFVVAIDDGGEFDAVLIGREGAAGGIISHGSLPAFSRIEQLGMLLGAGRSYVSRVIQKFKAARLVETRRKAFLVRNAGGLQAKACLCDAVSKRHFDEVMDGLYPK
jgi:hypothetical protein